MREIKVVYKLFTLRKDGTIGPLFINRRERIPLNEWVRSGYHPTKGFTPRPGWHCILKKSAPHLSKKGRVWAEVAIKDYHPHYRPVKQGGLWYTAEWMKVLRLLKENQ